MNNETINIEQIRAMYAEMLIPIRLELAELRGEQTSQEEVIIINHLTPTENED